MPRPGLRASLLNLTVPTFRDNSDCGESLQPWELPFPLPRIIWAVSRGWFASRNSLFVVCPRKTVTVVAWA